MVVSWLQQVNKIFILLKSEKLIMSKTKPILNQSSVKNFATSMILDAFAKSEQDNLEISMELKKAIAEIIETISLIEADNDEPIMAGIEGILEGVLIRQRGSIERLQSQIEYLQTKLNKANRELQQQIEFVFQELEDISKTQNERVQQAINNALVNIDR